MNYKNLGFKAGLEIHQQLEGKKLFCNCPALNLDNPNLRTERRLRAVIGETGKVDVAAAHEMSRARKFIYVSNSEDTCQIDYDEEPPLPVNEHHLHTALMVSKMLNADIVDNVQVMRKTVVDGSNVSGFQRTMLVGRNGWIKTSKGKVGITAILLEEEAAQKLDEGKDFVKYKLDRLGIGLLEISTDASLKDPEHVKETAGLIGMVLRSTERIRRGLGTIRQDVNISIKNGARTEVKGFQDLRSIPKIIEKEIQRQRKAIEKGEKLDPEVRKANPDFTTSFLRPMPGEARLYPETDVLPIKTKSMIKLVKIPELISEKAAKLEKKYGLNSEMAREIVKEKIDFEKFLKVKPDLTAHILINIPKDIKARLKLDSSKLKEKDFMEVLEKLSKDEISKDDVTDILSMKIQGKKVNYSKFKKVDNKEIEKEVEKIIKAKPGLSPGAYMGLIMGKLKGVDGKEVMKILNRYL